MRKSVIVLFLLLIATLPLMAQEAAADRREEIQAFNRKLEIATRSMDNSATLALWAEDDISLLPSTKPIEGKAAIAAFLEDVTAQIRGARMQTFELECFAIDVSGDLASEWCSEHQVVVMPEGKPPFDGRGKMLLILRRGSDGRWCIEREMWNQA